MRPSYANVVAGDAGTFTRCLRGRFRGGPELGQPRVGGKKFTNPAIGSARLYSLVER